MRALVRGVLGTRAPTSTLLIRLMVGLVFVSEGAQKFLHPAEAGAGRFAQIGFKAPEATARFVAYFEVTCGAAVLVGLLTRPAALPLIIIMLTALVSTKLPLLVGRDVWAFHVKPMSRYGLWTFAHEARTDWAMLLGSLFLLIVGAGEISFDAWLTERKPGKKEAAPPAPQPRQG